MTHNRSGSFHFTEIGTSVVQPLTLTIAYNITMHFPAIRHNLASIFENVQNALSASIRIFRIMTGAIAEHFTLHVIIMSQGNCNALKTKKRVM